MPYKDKAKRAEAVRRHRAKRQAASAVIPPFPSDPSGELARWSRDVLKVPVGHPRTGEPMILPGVLYQAGNGGVVRPAGAVGA